jgi:hypothetical protein
MDAISPEFRLEPTGPGGFVWGEWQVDDDDQHLRRLSPLGWDTST